jgi:hypothetical protein
MLLCLIFLIISVSEYQLYFFFSVILFGIVFFESSLRNIVQGIYLKIGQLLMVFLLISLIVYIYASIGITFYYEHFIKDDNIYCSTLFSCFTHIYLFGFRIREGIAVIMKQLSYNLEWSEFLSRTVYNFTHFFLNAVIMLNIVLAIVIDSYKELREKSNKYYNEMMNNCLICGASREEMEQAGNNFKHHIENVHKVDDYINCMIYLRIQNLQDLNSIQAAIKQKLNNNDTSWFPIYIKSNKVEDNKVVEENHYDASKLMKDIQENNDALLKIN